MNTPRRSPMSPPGCTPRGITNSMPGTDRLTRHAGSSFARTRKSAISSPATLSTSLSEDLSDPKLGSAAMRAAKAPVSASLIGTVPFIYASERVTLMLDDIRASIKWPEVFEDAAVRR